MGLEILEEFRPITPIRTVRTLNKHVTQVSDLESSEEDVEECRTPTSASQTLRTPLVCPPAPKKPRLPPKTNNLDPPSQPFFQVPHDLASRFLQRTPNRSLCF
ncbi:hypothetical protein VNO77_23237 [Canavalia gladiata]|uniref:Uncharacterized protein n=1 Tax=Canavalia gladiata TaxID=3824 RepID=A0AAN9QBB9_CANGL